jgi:hypothetical protein
MSTTATVVIGHQLTEDRSESLRQATTTREAMHECDDSRQHFLL